MLPFHLAQTRTGLEACLRTVRTAQFRFAEWPARALGYFLEGPGEPLNAAFHSPDAAAHVLGLPRENVVLAQPLWLASGPVTHSGPYCLYLLPSAARDGVEGLTRQLAALRPAFEELARTLNAASDLTAGLLPTRVSSWWEALFHLATHFPTTFLGAVRGRWAADARGPLSAAARRVTFEEDIRFFGAAVPPTDVVPGVMWVGLEHDVFASTERAVEVVLEHLTRAEPLPPAPGTFAVLHQRFADIGASIGRLPEPDFPRPRLVKFANTFETEPTGEWCDFRMRIRFERLPLSRCYAEAEYLVHRGTRREHLTLWAAAGAALAASAPDGAVMFTNTEATGFGGLTAGVSCGHPYLNPAPEARWVRFVLNALKGDALEIRWRHPLKGPAQLELPLYGEAVLPFDFATASARAIERARLLDNTPAAGVGGGDDEDSAGGEADGPIDPFKFRYRGREADLSGAVLRHTLLQSLWNSGTGRPADSQEVDEVMDLVYPGEDGADDKLKNLKAETNAHLTRAGVPLKIKSAGGRLWLDPSP